MIPIRIKANHLKHDYSDQGVPLTLPAEKSAILDALDKARVPYGSGEYKLASLSNVPRFLDKMLNESGHSPSLAELNHLAERLESLSEESLAKLDGILEIRKSYDIADAINATHNPQHFVQHPVYDDRELGEVAIDAGLYEPLEEVPDELLKRLDPAKVGALVREQDGGMFTNGGYVIREGDGWEAIYDGKSLAGRSVMLEPGEPVVSLLLSKDEYFYDEADSGWLHCPASEQEIGDLLEKTQTESLDDLTLHDIRRVVPTLADSVFYGATIPEINTLAMMIQTHCAADLVKYKAVCELENVTEIDTAMNLTKRLHEYDFEPCPSTEAFGRTAMEKTGADMKLLEEYGFDFDAYGWKAMQEQGVQFLSYGFISHPRGQEQTMEMTEPKPPLDPTMGM
jgi:hypothetical protein